MLDDSAAASRCLIREQNTLLILGCCEQDRFGILSYGWLSVRVVSFIPHESAMERVGESVLCKDEPSHLFLTEMGS